MKKAVIKIGLKCVAGTAIICGGVALKKCITENKRLRESRDTYKKIAEEQEKLLERYKKFVGPVDG